MKIEGGGVIPPVEISGARVKWQNAQNSEKNNITSLKINKINPTFRPPTTGVVWNPPMTDSSIMFETHKPVTMSKNKTADPRNQNDFVRILLSSVVTTLKTPALAIRGQGLLLTKCIVIYLGQFPHSQQVFFFVL